jgi:DNA invertase Pin-like site-specific DNA recombinase
MFARKQYAVAYYRVSTDRQGKSMLGLEAQQMAVCQYANGHDLQLLKEYTEVESGKKDNRPMLRQAIAYCRKHKSLLIIARLDRLARNVAFISSLMESNIEFIAVDNPGASKIVLHLLAAFAEHERDQISSRTKEALQAAKKRGTILGKHGKVLSQKNREAADEFAQKMRPAIEDLQRKGITSIRALAEELNLNKVPTFRKKGKWHATSVHNLLRRANKNIIA